MAKDKNAERKILEAEKLLRERLNGRIRDLRMDVDKDGVILRGFALTYYAKQLAQHTAMKDLHLAVVANEIEVRGLLTVTK